jgi:hypothetical protein
MAHTAASHHVYGSCPHHCLLLLLLPVAAGGVAVTRCCACAAVNPAALLPLTISRAPPWRQRRRMSLEQVLRWRRLKARSPSLIQQIVTTGSCRHGQEAVRQPPSFPPPPPFVTQTCQRCPQAHRFARQAPPEVLLHELQAQGLWNR